MELSDTSVSIINYLSAYKWEDVKLAVQALNKDKIRGDQRYKEEAVERMKKWGWVELSEGGEIPKGYEWRRIGGKVYVRDPSIPVEDPSRVTVHGSAGQQRSARKKTDTSVKRVTDLKCPACGGEMFKEGICPACEEGRRGLKIRLLCGECEYTLAL